MKAKHVELLDVLRIGGNLYSVVDITQRDGVLDFKLASWSDERHESCLSTHATFMPDDEINRES